MNHRLVFSLLAVAAAVLATYAFRPSPEKLSVASGAALLYYNTPAAIRDGERVYVGYITSTGSVEVAEMDVGSRDLKRRRIHDYGKADDHAAPGLWSTDEGLLIATAFHGSDLFLYRLDRAGRVSLLCEWQGNYTYPRFYEVDGQIHLYVRMVDEEAGSLAQIERPQHCEKAEMVAQAEKGKYLYATSPDTHRTAWTVYDAATNKYGGTFVEGKEITLSASHLSETLAWSVAGPAVSVTRFEKAFECCGTGNMIAELYVDGTKTYESDTMKTAFYPAGIILSKEAPEGIFPMGRTFERRALSNMAVLAGCPLGTGYNSNPQYVRNGGGSYVWMEFEAPLSGKKFGSANISLCLIR